MNRSGAALLVMAGVFAASCASIVGFPDRTLDDADASAFEAGEQDGMGDTSSPDAPPVDAGPARATLSTTALDFGLVSCGAAAPAAKVVTITNSGGTPLEWSAALAPSSDFSLTGPSAGTIAGGATGTVTIAAAAVPALSGAGDTAQGMLTITTSDAPNVPKVLPIKRTAAGGTLSVIPLTADFGETPATVPAQDIPIAVKNTGNQPVQIGFGAPAAGTGFSLLWTNKPAAVSVAPGAAVPGLVAKFVPAALGTFTGTAAINVTGALCGTNPSVLTFTGKGTNSAASVQPGSLDFGLVDCGTTAAPKKLKIVNSSATAFNFNATLATGYYTLLPASGAVAGNSFVEVTVTPVMVPPASAVSPNLYGDTVTITTDAPGDDPHTVDLLETAHGAILMQSTAAIDFGSVLASSPATSTFTVSNAGNAPANVSYTVTPSVFSVAPQAQVVGGGASYTATARFAPTAQQAYSGTAQMTVAGTVLCAPLPMPPIALTGNGALSAQVSPSSVDFGLVGCGSTGSSQKVTLRNTSAAPFSWTAAVATAQYTITPTSGTLANNKSVDITITPKAIPAVSATTADLYADTLTITTNPALESPYVASIHMTAQGAILSFNPTALDFGKVKVGNGNSRSRTFSVVNEGNLAAAVTLGKTGAPYSVAPTSGTANAGSSLPATGTFTPTTVADGQTGTISVSTSAKRCGPLPAPITLTGDGT